MSDHDDLGPGLHKVGPKPYDYVYNPAKDERVSFVGINGVTYTGVVTDVAEDEATGSLEITIQQFPDVPQWIGPEDV